MGIFGIGPVIKHTLTVSYFADLFLGSFGKGGVTRLVSVTAGLAAVVYPPCL